MELQDLRPASYLQGAHSCSLIDLITPQFLRELEQASVLAYELGREDLATSLHSQVRELASAVEAMRREHGCGSELWLG